MLRNAGDIALMLLIERLDLEERIKDHGNTISEINDKSLAI